MNDVIVIGAGWSGLTAATRLAAKGHSVVVVDKGRGPGGRSATRRAKGLGFDHGAQYLTARSEAFRRQVRAWSESGLLAPWRPDIVTFGDRPAGAGDSPDERWVGVPGMNAVLRQLARGLDCRWQWRAVAAGRSDRGWRVDGGDGEALEGRALLMTAPPRQAAGLLGPAHALHDRLAAVEMRPCWAVMLGYASPRQPGFDAAFVNEGRLAWIAHDGGKPGRGKVDTWVVHAATGFSREHIEDPADAVVEATLASLGELAPALAQDITHVAAHRWRFSQPAGPGQESSVLSCQSQRLVLAGDWCAGGRVEGAWISGVAAARRLEALL